jgi:hypothetical protein
MMNWMVGERDSTADDDDDEGTERESAWRVTRDQREREGAVWVVQTDLGLLFCYISLPACLFRHLRFRILLVHIS